MRKLCVLFSLSVMLAACHDSSSNESRNAASKKAPVVSETSAPLQPPGKEFFYNFDSDKQDQMPAKFHGTLTGSGALGEWKVIADATAPSQSNVLAQVSDEKTSYRFPLAIAGDGSFKDLDLSVRFKPISGREDQAAGLVFRFKDADNYYIVRANALENNVVLYKVEGGKRDDLPLKGEGRTYGKKTDVPSQQWSLLRVLVTGNLIEVFLNEQKLYEAEDETFKEAGKIGVWTKADSVTYFDDLRIIAK
jgi:hypothetical protein